MERSYPLEHALLTRSHPPAKSTELIQTRYLSGGPPLLSLVPTKNLSSKSQSLLHTLRTTTVTKHNNQTSKNRAKSVKKRLRSFITSNQQVQREYKRTKSKVTLNKILRFEDYLHMNKLWTGYIRDLLGLNSVLVSPSTPVKTMLQKLSSAEYVGCYINVLRSRNLSLCGITGIVLLETMKYFVIIEDVEGKEKAGGLKMLWKDGTVFNFVVPLREEDCEEVLEFGIIGSRVCFRSDDRAVRKYKARASDDLGVLLADKTVC